MDAAACKRSWEPPIYHAIERPYGKAAPLQGGRVRAGLLREQH